MWSRYQLGKPFIFLLPFLMGGEGGEDGGGDGGFEMGGGVVA